MKFTPEDINQNNTWQVGTGDSTRAYHDIFLKYGVALVGPGIHGKEGEPKTKLFYLTNPDVTNWGAILFQVKVGDYIIARKGKSIIIAIGEVVEEYNHSDLFSDVEGWDLQHYIKVKWYKPLTKTNTIIFKNSALAQSTLQRCKNPIVFEKIYGTEFEEIRNQFNVEDLFLPVKIEQSEIVDTLIDQGIRIYDAENIKNIVYRVIKLAEWYLKNDPNTLESEIVSFLVIPFLVALGWSEQKIKIEYQNTDVALFNEPFIGNYELNPHIIIEVKKFDNGLAFTNGQIERYASRFPYCQKFIATNGFCYKYFKRDQNGLLQVGYFNLIHMVERNELFDVPLSSIQTILEISNLK